MLDGEVDNRVRAIISFFKFGNARHADELTDDIEISDLDLTDEDTIALADALNRFALTLGGHTPINTNDMNRSGLTVGDVIALVKRPIVPIPHPQP